MNAPWMCEVEWEFDVHFYVMCTLPVGHDGSHRGMADGNGGSVATIRWNSVPVVIQR